MNTYTFKCFFICAITGEEKETIKEYKAANYMDAKIGIRQYFADNSTITDLLELEKILITY